MSEENCQIFGLSNIDMEDHAVNAGSHDSVFAVFDKTSKSIQAFHPENKSWRRVHVVTDDIISKSFTAVVLDESIYIFASDKTNYKLDITNPEAGWIQLPDRQETDMVMAVACKGGIYAFHDLNDSSRAIEKLDTTSTTWNSITNKTVACYRAALVNDGDCVYSFGGFNGHHMNTTERLDTKTLTWNALPKMPSCRNGAAGIVFDERIFVAGGYSNRYLTTVECFNKMSEEWTTLNSMAHTRYMFNICVAGGRIFAVGGKNSENSIEELNPDTNTWKFIGKMPGKIIHDQATIVLYL